MKTSEGLNIMFELILTAECLKLVRKQYTLVNSMILIVKLFKP